LYQVGGNIIVNIKLRITGNFDDMCRKTIVPEKGKNRRQAEADDVF
jgi:hypothetical protein